MHKKTNILLALILITNILSAQQAYRDGWEALLKNNRTKAREYFNQEASTNPEALLSLSLIDWNENKLEDAFDHFKSFYETSTDPYSYFYAVSTLPFMLSQTGVLNSKKIEFFEKIVSDPKMNGTLKAMLYEKIGTHYIQTNNRKKALENYSKMGVISNWQVLGTFDNTSGSGFQKNWGAVEKVKESDKFWNNVNAEVNWYSPVYNSERNWFNFEYYFPVSNSIMYAQSFVNSPSAQEAYLRVGTSGSMKVWINDALAASVPEERNCDLDIYAYKVKLNQGNNRILIQIGSSEISQANFLLRLTDENGIALSGLTSKDSYVDYVKSNENYSLTQIPLFAEQFFQEKIKTNPNNPLDYVLLAQTYLRNDKAYEGTKILKELEKLKGKSTLISYLLREAYIRAKNQTDSEKELEQIKNTDPDSFFGLEYRYDEAVESEKYTEAENIVNTAKKLYGESEQTEQWEFGLNSLTQRYEEMLKDISKLYSKYPSSYEYLSLAVLVEKEINKNPKGATALIENYLKKYSNENAIDLLAKSYFEAGNSNKGIAALTKRLTENPYASGYYANLISTLFSMQKYTEALSFSDSQLKLTPFISSVYAQRGQIYKNMNKTDNARESFKKAIYFEPTNYEARTQLRQLDKQKEVFDLFPKIDLQNLIANAPGTDTYPDDNSIILVNEQQQVVYPEGAKEYRTEVAIKILNQGGIESWKEYHIPYYNNQKLIIDKSEVIKSNGSISKAETNENQIIFTNLEVNDVLHLEYRVQDYSSGKLANQFFDQFSFNNRYPTIKTTYRLLVPEDKKFEWVVTNSNVQPTITQIENNKLYTWELTNQEAIKHEPYMSTFIDATPTLTYSSLPNWKYVSDWYKDLTASKFNPDYVFNATYNELMRGKENLSKLEKAKIFYNYILDNITYSSVDFMQSNFIPQKASRTITTRLGDCKDLSTLFVALCRKAGIDANLVLIATRNYGSKNLVLPIIRFNHAIAQLNIDKKNYYLELTDNSLPFGAAPYIDLNSEILSIPYSGELFGDKIERFEMPNRMLNTSSRNHLVKISGNDMNVDFSNTSYANISSLQRSKLKDISAEEQLKLISESVAERFISSSKVSNLNFKGIDGRPDSLTESYSIEVKNALQDVAGMKIFSLPWSDINSLDFVSLESRKYPLEYWAYQVEDETTETMTIILPQGMKPVDTLVNQNFDCPTASYSLTFDTKTPGKIIAKRHFVRKNDYISTQDYPAFKDFMNKVSESDNKKLAIK